MTHTELMALAKQAGATPYTNRHFPDRTHYTFSPEQLAAFAHLCRADLVAEVERLREVWLEDSVRATEDRGDLLKERDALTLALHAASRVCDQDKALMREAHTFLHRVTHWQEGKPDLHDMKVALRARLGGTNATEAKHL
jgi:hypothetical protein